MSKVYYTLSSGEFIQLWTNTGLITTNDDWSNVASIVGYLGDDTAFSGTDRDARTVTMDFTTIDVIANATTPNTSTAGGVAEFELADPTIALQGSAAADNPNIVIYLDSTGRQDVTLNFNVRDIDGSGDNAAQQVVVQYRTATSGAWTTIPGAYLADATTGPNLATLVTPMAIALPADANNQPTLEVRIMTSNALGSDEWVGIDDIHVNSSAVAGATPALSVNDVSLNEGNAGTTSYTFTVSLSAPAPAGGVTFDIATADGTATSGSGDYTAKSLTSQTIPAGSSTYSFTVLVNGDTAVEPNENFFVNVTNVTGANVNDAQGQGTIVTDDIAPNLTINDVTVNEGNAGTTSFIFTVSLSAPAPAGGVTFDIATADGTATSGSGDYTVKSLTSQTIPAGSSTYSFTVLVNGDTAVEPNETFFVNVTNVTGANVTDGQGLATITNEDVPPVPAVSVNDVTLAEGQSGVTYANFTVSLSFAHSATVTVDYATANGNATAGSDYLGIGGTLSFAPGETSKTVSVPIVGDSVNEANETFTVNLSNVSGATIGDGSGLGTIANDDGPGYFALNGGNFSENWTDTGRITANDDWSNVASIRGFLGDIDSGSPAAVDPRTLTGPNLGAIDVIANQGNPTTQTSGGVAEFEIANPVVALQGSGTADAPSLVLYMDARGRTDIHLTATLRDVDSNSDNAVQPIAVQYRTSPTGGWTNVPGGYFADVTTGGSATQTTSLDVTLPADANNAATLQIRLLTTNATGSDEWVGIDDIVVSSNQGPPSYSIADAAVLEGNSGTTPISFTVTRAGDASAAGSVAYTVVLGSDGFSASAGDFASPLTGSVSFGAGETSKTIVLDVNGDTLPEADEGFTVTLSSPSSGTLGDASATGTIVNDDGPPPFVTISDVTQAEGDGGTTAFTFTVTRTGGTTGFSVDYATLPGTASAPSDYSAASGTLTFLAGENSKSVTVLVNGDTAGEHAETFTVQLTNPVGAVIADPVGLGTILNDDVVPIYELQGAGHISAFEGETVKTQGIVTAVDSNGFYLQDPNGDGNSATSDAIFVFTGSAPTVLVGDSVNVTGILTEFASDATNLTLTEINSPTITLNSHDNALPAAVLIGTNGILPPTTFLDNDGLTSFDPAQDGLDFYESLEGMRVTIDTPIAVSNTNNFGETYVVASGGVGATGMNGRGGITLSGDHPGTPVDYNPERIQIDDDSAIFAGFNPNYTQGDRLSSVSGILSYSFNSYEVLVTAPVIVTQDVTLQQETTSLDGDFDHLTVADYNVENLDPGDPQLKFDLLADDIVFNLSAPDIIGLQEIQDADGPGAGTDFSGYATAQKLIDAIVAAGGPTYAYVEVTPTGSTGGEANGHIHPGYLYNPDRVSYVPGSASIITGSAYAGSRNPLVASFTFNSQTIQLINVHFTSRIGSDPLEGAVQPPQDAGDASRTAQAQGVADYVTAQLAANPALKLGVLGDFNGFYFENAVGTIEATGLTDLHRILAPQERYSYFFDGNAQAIDHILVSPGLFNGAQFDAVHLNSEFSNNTDRPTDHDSVIARFTIAHPDPVILPATDALGAVTELPDGAPNENVAILSDSGVIAFANPDPSLTHSASFAAQGGNYLGTFTLTGVDQGSDSVGWTFSVSDADLNTLAQGVVKQYYTVTIDDGHGGSVDQIVEVDIFGTNDAAHLSSGNVTVEQGADPATASGALTISDEDGPNQFQPQASTQGNYGDFTIDAAGQWSYVADQVYALGAGESRSDVFTVLAADGTPTTVAVTITGPDAVATARQDRFATTEAAAIGAGLNLFTDNGSGPDSDPDGPLSITAVNGAAVNVGHALQLASGALVVVNADGTFSYDPNHAFDGLSGVDGAANHYGLDSFTYTIDGGSTATVLIDITGLSTAGDLAYGGGGNDRLTGTNANENFRLDQGGSDEARGGGGNDGFYFGATFGGGDIVDGGSGTDTLALQGDVDARLDGVTNVEVILAMSGSDARFGDAAGHLYSYDLVTVDGNVGPGQTLTITGAGLLPGETLHVDGSAERDGNFRIFAGRGVDDLTGGAGSDGFFFGADGNLTRADHVDGGAGTDTIALRGNYTGGNAVVFQDGSVSNVEVLAMLSGHSNEFGGPIAPGGFDYDVTLANGNVAGGRSFDVNAARLAADESLRFDGRLEADGFLRILSGAGDDTLWGGGQNDLLYGGLGKDWMRGGPGADTYLYRSAAESTSTGYDTISGFDWHVDRIDAPGGGIRSFSQAASATLSTASFDGDLAAGLSGVLGAGQAALFTANGGSLAGHVFAVIDANGIAGYQAGQDLVIELVDAVTPIDPTAGIIV